MPTTILLVEDYPHHLRLIGNILKRDGHTVIEATNIDDALAKIEEFKGTAETDIDDDEIQPNLIAILDVGIPQSSDGLVLKRGGIALLEKLHRAHREIPVILLTVYGEADDVVKKAKECNAQIVAKPLHSKQLLRAVKDIT